VNGACRSEFVSGDASLPRRRVPILLLCIAPAADLVSSAQEGPMKKSLMLIFPLLPLFVSQLSGCGPLAMQANDDRRVKFDNYFTEPFSARNQPAATSQEKELTLLEKGYAKIGNLEVLRATERCLP
jgi:hypothetical protein